jgi:hypothetical protein
MTNDISLDYSAIQFPSDSLSVKDLRRLFPKAFDVPVTEAWVGRIRDAAFHMHESLDAALGNVLDAEREVAERAFQSALGSDPRKWSLAAADEVRDCLAADYVRTGIAAGEHQAQEFIRNIERQAISQAHLIAGKSL